MFAEGIMVSDDRVSSDSWKRVLKSAQLRRHRKTGDSYIHLGELLIR